MISRFTNESLCDKIIGTSVGDYYDMLNHIEDNSLDAILDKYNASWTAVLPAFSE